MKLSICCITYNQENFIHQTIDSFLMQKMDFDFEIIVGDDSSTDKTAEICLDYQTEFPEFIKVFISKSNVGMTNNFVQTLKRAKGEYIAICEGDDFWTDSYKIKKQIDFLDANMKYVGCFHNTEERYEENLNRTSFLHCSFPTARPFAFSDIVSGNVIPTCSVVFRNRLLEDFPPWYFDLKMADWPLHLLNAQFGSYWYIPQVMGVHRLHSQSVWMMQDPDRNNRYVIEAYDHMVKGFKNNFLFVESLKTAKRQFLERISPDKIEWSLKKKIKFSIINFIEKL